MRWKDGAERHIQAFFEQVTQPDGSLHINLVAQDITDLRHNEQRANQAERLQTIGKLTGGIAHDFNNILAVISGNLELLVTDLSDEERHICVKHALSAVGRGADLTRQLLAVARDQPLKPEAFQPVLMMAEIVPLLEMSVGVNIKITVEGDGISEHVKADRPQLEACILNLAVNARDAMPEGGTLTLCTGIHTQGPKAMPGTEDLAEGTYVTLSAEDTGTGMHPQVAARVFEPFFTTKAIGQGTGIGLSTVLGFAQQSGGTARVHSEIGKGTTVTLYLPRATMVPAPATKKHRRKIVPVLRGVKVLLIEDEVSLAETYCRHLRAQGCTVNHCIDAQHAFEVVANTPDPDLILSDVQLPGPMDGITLTHQLLEKFPTARAILMSGYSDKIAALQDTEGFELATMQKPFTLAALSTSIAKELQAPAKKR